MLTYIESPMWEGLRANGPDGFTRNFENVDDAAISSDLKTLRDQMKVFLMNSAEQTAAADADDETFTRVTSKKQSRYLKAVQILNDTGLTEVEKIKMTNEDTCVSAGHVADLIIGLSKARRVVHTGRNWLFVLIVSGMHASVPVWHAWLPTQLGGGCGVSLNEGLWKNGTLFNAQYDVGKILACSASHWQVAFHGVCAVVNLTLSFAILNRLVRCRADYYARYCHMLYFIQLTPWSNLRKQKLKDHWGFLPTFDLSTVGNVEAWNKLRLYLQSAQIKSSRYKQVSVLWCFIAVVMTALLKIIEMIVVQTHKAANPGAVCNIYFPNRTAAPEGCNSMRGCIWVEHVARGGGCVIDQTSQTALCNHISIETPYDCLHQNA